MSLKDSSYRFNIFFYILLFVFAVCFIVIPPFMISFDTLTSNLAKMHDSFQNYINRPILCYFMLLKSTMLTALVVLTISYFFCLILSLSLTFINPSLALLLAGLFKSLRFLPAIAWLPLISSLIRELNGPTMRFLFISLGICPIILCHLLHAFATCNIEKTAVVHLSYLHSPKNFIIRKYKRFRHIILPNSLDESFQSLRLGAGISIILELVYEWLFPGTIGIARIADEISYLSIWQKVLFVFILAGIGIIFDEIVEASGFFTFRWLCWRHRPRK